jgi:hypothetical protein
MGPLLYLALLLRGGGGGGTFLLFSSLSPLDLLGRGMLLKAERDRVGDTTDCAEPATTGLLCEGAGRVVTGCEEATEMRCGWWLDDDDDDDADEVEAGCIELKKAERAVLLPLLLQ